MPYWEGPKEGATLQQQGEEALVATSHISGAKASCLHQHRILRQRELMVQGEGPPSWNQEQTGLLPSQGTVWGEIFHLKDLNK